MTNNSLPDWVQYLQALAVPTLAIFGTLIAWRQFSLARDRMRYDLYDRRYKIFEAARKFLAEIMRDGDCSLDQIFEFTRNTGDAVFLFDTRVTEYLEGMRKRAFEIRKADALIANMADPQRPKAIEVKYAQLNWFTEQFPVLIEKFQPFLELRGGLRRSGYVILALATRWFCLHALALGARLRGRF